MRATILLGCVAGCITTAPEFPPPSLPPTPLRIAIAPVDVDPRSYGTTIPPNVRGDLVEWLDKDYQLSVVASPSVDAMKPLPAEDPGFRIDWDHIRALCQAGRGEHVDVILFTTFRYGHYDPGACKHWEHEWSTSGTGDCVETRPTGQRVPTTHLAFRALYPATCVFGRPVDLSAHDYGSWGRYRDLTRSRLPDALRAFDTMYWVGDDRVYNCPGDNPAACAAPTTVVLPTAP